MEVVILHDIWNPWHGCVKCSEGCQNCYMYFLDRMRDQNGAEIYKTKSGFSYPLQKDRTGHYKIQERRTDPGLHDLRFLSWKRPTRGGLRRGTSCVSVLMWCFSC